MGSAALGKTLPIHSAQADLCISHVIHGPKAISIMPMNHVFPA